MSQEIINTGALPNDGDGDPLRVAFAKVNNNFSELYSISSAAGPNGAVQYNSQTVGSGATGNTAIVGGVLTTINILLSGEGYSEFNPPVVTITPDEGDTTGSGASAYAIVTGNSVSDVVITSGGGNYTLPPIVTFEDTVDNELAGSANLVLDTANSALIVGANIVPLVSGMFGLGTSDNKAGNVFISPTGLRVGNVRFNEDGNALTLTAVANSSVKGSIITETTTGNTVNANTTQVGATTVSKTSSLELTTYTNSANQVVFQTPVSSFSEGKFRISSTEWNTQNRQAITLTGMKAPDSQSVNWIGTESQFNGNLVIQTYNIDVSSGNVRVLIKPYPNTEINHTVVYTVTN